MPCFSQFTNFQSMQINSYRQYDTHWYLEIQIKYPSPCIELIPNSPFQSIRTVFTLCRILSSHVPKCLHMMCIKSIDVYGPYTMCKGTILCWAQIPLDRTKVVTKGWRSLDLEQRNPHPPKYGTLGFHQLWTQNTIKDPPAPPRPKSNAKG